MTEVSDIATRLLHPAVQALLLGVLAAACVLLHRPRTALVSACVALAWIWLASTPALALALRAKLATPPPGGHPRADAIVVLGGGALPPGGWSRVTTRAGTGLSLWRQDRAPLLLVSGRDQARQLAEGYTLSGVPGRQLLVEGDSENTRENARDSALLLRSRGIDDVLLVTSSIHMRRAAAAFRKQGIAVSPAPVAEPLASLAAAPPWLPRREALTMSARCLREYVALWVYRERDWI